MSKLSATVLRLQLLHSQYEFIDVCMWLNGGRVLPPTFPAIIAKFHFRQGPTGNAASSLLIIPCSLFLTIFMFQFFIMCSERRSLLLWQLCQPTAPILFMHYAAGGGAKCKIPIGFIEWNSRCRLALGNRQSARFWSIMWGPTTNSIAPEIFGEEATSTRLDQVSPRIWNFLKWRKSVPSGQNAAENNTNTRHNCRLRTVGEATAR